MSHRYQVTDEARALGEVPIERCARCGLRRRLVGVLVAKWNTIGNVAKEFPVSRTIHLYQARPRAPWTTELPRCAS